MAEGAASAMAPAGPVNLLQGYKRHITSEFCKDRYPYLEDIRSHLKTDDVSMAFGERLFPRLVEQLKNPDMAPENLVEALRTICDLASHQENKCNSIASDVVAAATNLLLHDSVPVKRDAARVISSMAQLIGGRSLMPLGNTSMRKSTSPIQAGPTLPKLVKLLLSSPDEVVKMNVAEALKSLALFRDGCQQIVDQGTVKGVALYLCSRLPDLPESKELSLCLLYLLQMLGQVTMYANNGMRDLWGVGLVAKVIRFLEHIPKETGLAALSPADSTETKRQALRLLWHCGNDPHGRRETLKEAEGVRVITEFLSDGDAKVREAAVCALNVVTLETDGKKDVLKYSTEGLAALLVSDKETAYLIESCIQLVRCASELPAFRFAFARHILKEIWLLEKIFGTTALAAVSPLMGPTEENDTRVQAVRVVEHFLKSRKSADGDLIRTPPVCPLDHIDDPRLFACEECVDIFHHLVDILSLAQAPALHCLEALCSVAKGRQELRGLIDSERVKVPAKCQFEITDMLQSHDF